MPTAFQLTATLPDGHTVAVAVTRKRVRNLNLRVHADGTVVLSIPLRTGAATAQDFLDRRADWIAKRLAARVRAAETPLIPLSGLDAGTLPLWGALVDAAAALELDSASGPTVLKPQSARRDVGASPSQADTARFAALPPDELQARIDSLYRREIEHALPEVAARAEETMGVRAARWSVRRMKTRWGSCTPSTAVIRINTALAAYPPPCLEFVVVHELVHLMEPSHNQRFHMLLDIYCPGNRDVAKLLKQPARELAKARSRCRGGIPQRG